MSTSLSRAFTTKRAARSTDSLPTIPKRSLTTKHSGTIRQQKISGPVELLSTTNMLSYNAPDIFPRSRSSTTSSAGSMTMGSSASEGSPSVIATPLTTPEASSIESSPIMQPPDLNHLSCYFGASASEEEAPQIPKRAPSHTKKLSERIARKRSLSRMASPKSSISTISSPLSGFSRLSSPKNSISTISSPNSAQSPKSAISRISSPQNSISTTRSSMQMFSPNPDSLDHPFGNELAQVSELAEQFGMGKEKLAVLDEEEQELISMGLYKFAADDYMNELQGLYITAFGDLPPSTTVWI